MLKDSSRVLTENRAFSFEKTYKKTKPTPLEKRNRFVS